jgi:hypothetical protein
MELSNSTIVSVGSSDRNVSNLIILAFSVPLIGVESDLVLDFRILSRFTMITSTQQVNKYFFGFCLFVFGFKNHDLSHNNKSFGST